MALCLLHIAAQYGHEEVVKLLLGTAGVEVNVATSGGCTPLHLTVQYGHVEVVKLLLDTAGIEVNVATSAMMALCLCILQLSMVT